MICLTINMNLLGKMKLILHSQESVTFVENIKSSPHAFLTAISCTVLEYCSSAFPLVECCADLGACQRTLGWRELRQVKEMSSEK